ncbi:hypothetical protein HHL17_22195 [Chitinophaga sp. G-6-1-13]|uniref:DUF4595 domain-containing protein n=1 Tax=Chitinophaga fulva TaxID=2728842 RepID=A0A848GW65_9BACT|nr:hypothetical protein [Chitinophaga fulva]NML39928.1 hypothetical protein [Chitinophaga fulva]
MKKVWLGMAALALMAASCSGNKSDDIVTPEVPKTPDWRVAGIIGVHLDDKGEASNIIDSTVFAYNPDKTFSFRETFQGETMDFYFKYTVGYDKNNIVNLTRKFGLTGTPKVITETHLLNNQIVRYFEPGYANTRYDSLVYENNKIVKVVFKHEDIRAHKIWEYTWQGDNVVEERAYMTNQGTLAMELVSIYKHTYSNVPNIFKSMTGLHLLREYIPNVQQLSANMVNTTTITDATGKLQYQFAHSRSMNDKNLPATDTVRQQTFGSFPGASSSVSHYKYIDLNK